MEVGLALLEQSVDLVVGVGENVGLAGAGLAAGEYFVEQLGQIFDGLPHLQSHESEGRPVVEQDDENDAPRDIREQHRFPFALVEERIEIRFTDELRQLIVRTEVGRRECSERGRIEIGLLAYGRDELPTAIDDERAASVAIVQESL